MTIQISAKNQHSAAVANVDTVIVDGRVFKRGGRIISVSIEER